MDCEYEEYYENIESEDDDSDFEELWEYDTLEEDSSFVDLPPAEKIAKLEQKHWIGGVFDPHLFAFDATNSGISPHIQKEDDSPLHWFECFFDVRLMDVIVGETNRYHHSIPVKDSDKRKHQKEWEPVNRKELYRFLAVVMLMSAIRKATLMSYWSTDPLIATPIFGEMMPRDRFLAILRRLHFNNNEEQPDGDRLFKIEPVMNILKEKFQQFFTPYQNVCIDESLMLWKGRLAFKQYIPKKRHRFGVKFFVIVDCLTGMILDFIIYVGSETEIECHDELGISGSIVMTLMNSYLGKGHNLYVDNWYTSPKLFEELQSQKTGACGTVKTNRSEMPTFAKTKPGDLQHLHRGNLLAVKWHDKREVHMLTTINRSGLGQTKKKDHRTGAIIEKPLAIIDYNANMGGVDKSDMQIHFIECARKTVKWYKKVFFHLVDMVLLNAFNMYRIKNKKRQTLGEFRIELVRQIIEKYGTNPGSGSGRRISSYQHPKRLEERHFPSLIPFGAGSAPKQLTCVVCSHSVRKERKRSKSRYECVDCNVGLCINGCFKEYHTLLHF